MQGGTDTVAGVRVGDVLAGKYRVERILGVGGMGVVVAAHHLQLDERVALKFLLPGALQNGEAVARFAREAQAAAKIKSEYVARVVDVGTLADGAPYMVMEYLEGGDLAAWLKDRGPLSIEQGVEFVLQACVAIAEAHALGIVHRDLKPANLFVIRRPDGQLAVKVLDFGISKITGKGGATGAAVTRTSALMGSPLYMSPEQMMSSKDVDARTDLWALGVVLFELTTGRPPFSGESVTELAVKVTHTPAPLLRELRADAPAGLEAVLVRCLAKDRRERYANVAELARALMPFAPARMKPVVERICGTIGGAGLPVTLAAGVESPLGDTAVHANAASVGTLRPVGRTTHGGRRRGVAALAVGAASIVAVALFAGILLQRRMSARHDDLPRSSGIAVDAMVEPAPVRADTAPTSIVTSTPPSPTIPAAAPAVEEAATPPRPTAPPKGGRRATPPPRETPPKDAAQAPPNRPAAAANCSPPYFFDAKGNRVFKPECL